MDYEELLMAKSAWYYYVGGLTQQSIGEKLGVSRIHVMKLLELARQNGVVTFRLREESFRRFDIEKKMLDRFGLSDVFIAPAPTKDMETAENVAYAAAMYIETFTSENDYINMGYGYTLGKVLNHLAMNVEKKLSIISLSGGVSCYLPDTKSSIFNAKLYLMPAPLVVSSSDMAKAIIAEPSVQEVIMMRKLASTTIVGIGGMNDDATVVKSGTITKNDFRLLSMQNAVGDVLCHFYDKNGNPVGQELDSRLISTPLETLKSLNKVIGVSAGKYKVDAILGALRAGLLDVLITDEDTAEAVLAKAESED